MSHAPCVLFILDINETVVSSTQARKFSLLGAINQQFYGQTEDFRFFQYLHLSYQLASITVFIAEVTVANAVSMVTAYAGATVAEPPPRDLQLTELSKPSRLPTCSPANLDETQETIQAFRGQALTFKASVSSGNNLAFNWTFSGADVISSKVTRCQRRQHCLQNTQASGGYGFCTERRQGVWGDRLTLL